MKTVLTIEVRCFPVTIRDERTGEVSQDYIILDKARLQACGMVGESSKELIQRIFNRRGFWVLEIGKPERRSIDLNLSELWQLHDKAVGI